MSSPKIGISTSPAIVIDPIRKRETPPPAVSFKDIMLAGNRVFLAGAHAITGLVGGPALSAAVANAKAGADAATGTDVAAAATNAATGSGSNISSAATTGSSEFDNYRALQQQKLNDDLSLLKLQDEIQRQNRQISLISNVMKARHETAKGTISNIRS